MYDRNTKFLFRNACRLMSLVDFPRSPHLDVVAVLGPCCSHAAYCLFHMFEGLDVGTWGGRGFEIL